MDKACTKLSMESERYPPGLVNLSSSSMGALLELDPKGGLSSQTDVDNAVRLRAEVEEESKLRVEKPGKSKRNLMLG